MIFLGSMLDSSTLLTAFHCLLFSISVKCTDITRFVFASYRNNLLPALPTPTISPGISLSTALTPTISPGIPLVGVPDILTTTNDSGIQGDTAQLSDDGVRSEGKETKEPERMLEDLRLFIADMGLKLEEGWEVIIKHRPSNLLITDKIYISPDGHKFRSRLQVARFLENPKRKTHLQSIAQRINVQPAAQKANVHPAPQRVCCDYA